MSYYERVAWEVRGNVEKMLDCGGRDGESVFVWGGQTIYMCADTRASKALSAATSEGECLKMSENGSACACNTASPGIMSKSFTPVQLSLANNYATDLRTTCQSKGRQECRGRAVRDHHCIVVWWASASGTLRT